MRRPGPNNSFKPNLLRYTKAMAEKACHGFGSTTQVGLTQALGRSPRFRVVRAGQKLSEREPGVHVRNVQVLAVDALRLRQPDLAVAVDRSGPPGVGGAVPVVVLALPVQPHSANPRHLGQFGIATAGAVVVAVRRGSALIRLVDAQHVPERLQLFVGQVHHTLRCGLTTHLSRGRIIASVFVVTRSGPAQFGR